MKKIFLATIVLLTAVVLLSGCPSAPPQGEGAGAGTPGGGTLSGGTPDAGTPAAGAGDSAFDQFVNTYSAGGEYMAAYTMSTTGQGVNTTAAYTMYYKGDKHRMDLSSGGLSQRIWFLSDRTVTCTQLIQSQPETCNQSPSIPGSYDTDAPTVDVEAMRLNASMYNIVSTGTRDIAGETGHCYQVTFSSPMGASISDYCLSIDGILLYSKVSASGVVSEMTVVQFSRTVSDEAMTPPETDNEILIGDLPDYLQ